MAMENRNCTTGSWIRDRRLHTNRLFKRILPSPRNSIRSKSQNDGEKENQHLATWVFVGSLTFNAKILLNLSCPKLKQNPAKDDIWAKTVDTSNTDTHHRMAQPNRDRPLPLTVLEWQPYLPCSQPLCYHLITLYPTALEIRRTSGCC